MKHSLPISSVAASILFAAISGCAGQRACSGAGCTSDDNTTAAVDAAIVTNTDLGPPGGIEVSTYDHVVYLTGVVDSEYQKEVAESVAESVAAESDGGSKVVSSISLSN
jgi:osmotically-inducible protein OsmY